jgi:hypothetical protein
VISMRIIQTPCFIGPVAALLGTLFLAVTGVRGLASR